MASEWRWGQPADHSEVAERIDSKKYEKRIGAQLEAAAADEDVDFDALVLKVKAKCDSEKAKKAK